MPTRPKPKETVNIAIRVPRDLYEGIGRIAEQEERTISAEVRRLMRRHIADQEANAA